MRLSRACRLRKDSDACVCCAEALRADGAATVALLLTLVESHATTVMFVRRLLMHGYVLCTLKTRTLTGWNGTSSSPSAISGMNNRFAQDLVTTFAKDIASIGAEDTLVHVSHTEMTARRPLLRRLLFCWR